MPELEDVNTFLKFHTNRVKHLYKKIQLAWWNAYSTGKEEYYKEYEMISKEFTRIYNNKEEFEMIKKWLKMNIKDELPRRQIKVVYNSYRLYQGDLNLINKIIAKEIAIQKKFNDFRAEVGNKRLTDNQIKEILKTETNPDRIKNAWEASKKQGRLVEKDLIEVINMRNKLAKSQGFRNYYVMSLEAAEQKLEDVKAIFDKLKRLTDKPFMSVKSEIDNYLSNKFNIPKKELKPWLYQDLFFASVPGLHKLELNRFFNKDILENAKKFYNGIGLEVEDVLERSDLYEKEGKSQHAFAIDIDREGDIRILVNIISNKYWMLTTLHELGHAVYWKFMDRKLPFLLRDQAHTLVTEAIAMLFERQSTNTVFIKKYTGANSREIDEISGIINNFLMMDKIVFSRWSQVMFNFEMELYENPEQDLNRLWWDTVKKYQFIDFYRDEPDWCTKIHLVSSPVYYHNYMLADLLASQLHKTIAKDILKQDSLKNADYTENKKIGDYLRKSIFEQGMLYEWNDLAEKATGERLSPKCFAEEFIVK